MNKIPLNIAGLDGGVIIKKGGGGGVTINNQEKSLEIVENGSVSITPDVGYTGLGKVNVNVDVPTQEINNQEKSVDITENGTTEVTADSGFTGLSKVVVNTNVQSGGVPVSKPVNDVNFYDYDGTILHSYTKDEFLALSAMPPLPEREGLICQEWNWDLDEAQEYVSENGLCDIGATYITNDGKTRLYIRIDDELRADVTLRFAQTLSNGVEVDWGDGSAVETRSGTSHGSMKHIYPSTGDFCITLSPQESCSISLGSQGYQGVVSTDTYDQKIGYYLLNQLQRAEIGANVSLLSDCFIVSRLKTINIPKGITTLQDAFTRVFDLECLVIPKGTTSILRLTGDSESRLRRISLPNSIQNMKLAFNKDKGIGRVVIPKGVTDLSYSFENAENLTTICVPKGINATYDSAFNYARSLVRIKMQKNVSLYNLFSLCYSLALIDCTEYTQVPSIDSSSLTSWKADCKVLVPAMLYDEWISDTNWSSIASQIVMDYTPIECVSLEITAENVSGRATSTKVSYTAITNGVNQKGERVTNVTIRGTGISNEFPQNTSYTDTVERTVSYTYLGFTATTTITQDVRIDPKYTLDLNGGQWALSDTVANPDAAVYDGVYQSVLSKGVDNGSDTMYIDIVGYENFKLYIRSYAEGAYDYVMASQLDQAINGSTSDTNTSLVKASTKGKQNSSASIKSYTLVEFEGIDGGAHRITIVYRKDSSGNTGDDQGYVLIPKNQ